MGERFWRFFNFIITKGCVCLMACMKKRQGNHIRSRPDKEKMASDGRLKERRSNPDRVMGLYYILTCLVYNILEVSYS